MGFLIGHNYINLCHCASKLAPRKLLSLKIMFYKSSRQHLLWHNYVHNKPTWDAGRTVQKLVNTNSAPASDLQAFQVFSQHPAWVFYTGKPIQIGVCCLKIVKATSPPPSDCLSTSWLMCSGHVVVIND